MFIMQLLIDKEYICTGPTFNKNLLDVLVGDDTVDEILTVLFSTSMFVGTLIGLLLDNTIPGWF